MSIRERAAEELKRANFGEEDSKVMMELVDKFFTQWDSGGAVAAVLPVFNRLIAGKPLTPLEGDGSEWINVQSSKRGVLLYQNKRCSSIFREEYQNGDAYIYDTDPVAGKGERLAILQFPYLPPNSEVRMPIMEVSTRK